MRLLPSALQSIGITCIQDHAVRLSRLVNSHLFLRFRYFLQHPSSIPSRVEPCAQVLLSFTMALFGAMSIPKPLLTLLLMAASVTPSEATMASWWNSIASQVVVLNETTGQYRYTRCNTMGMDTVYYSTTGGNYLNFTQSPPKAGSPLAGTGWYDQTNTWSVLLCLIPGDNVANFTPGHHYFTSMNPIVSEMPSSSVIRRPVFTWTQSQDSGPLWLGERRHLTQTLA